MPRRWVKLLIPLVGVSILASLLVSYTYADVDTGSDIAYAQPAETAPESGVTLSAAGTDGYPAITAPSEIMPGYVFVVDNREIVLERPTIQADGSKSSPETSEPSASGAVTAFVTVASYRLIVIDESDRITGIWSNTTGLKRPYYSLRVRDIESDGPEHPLTENILDQYNRLLNSVDWTVCGKVY